MSASATKIYINGVEVSSVAPSYFYYYDRYPLVLGSNADEGQYFKGYIDEFRVWNTERTLAQIRENMHLTSLAEAPCSG